MARSLCILILPPVLLPAGSHSASSEGTNAVLPRALQPLFLTGVRVHMIPYRDGRTQRRPITDLTRQVYRVSRPANGLAVRTSIWKLTKGHQHEPRSCLCNQSRELATECCHGITAPSKHSRTHEGQGQRSLPYVGSGKRLSFSQDTSGAALGALPCEAFWDCTELPSRPSNTRSTARTSRHMLVPTSTL